MKKPLRKAILLLLATAITAAIPLVAFASSDSPEQSMETALIAVKTLIQVDDDVFTEFSYGSSYSNWETREGLIWQFYWSDMKSSSINAAATADGVLLQYYKYQYDGRMYGFAEISKDEAKAAADLFIRKANPDTYTYYKDPSIIQTNLHDNAYTFVYSAEVNGYAFEAASLTVGVNKFTGEVSMYVTRNVDPGRYKFESASGIISENAAVAAYAEKIGLRLEYRSKYDYSDGVSTISVFPVYIFNSGSDRYIGAKTGEVVEYVYDLGTDDAANTSMGEPAPSADMAQSEAESGDGGSRANLTPAEREAIERLAGFLTSEQALEALIEAADLTGLDTSSFNNQYIGLSRDYLNSNRYYYDVNLSRYSEWDLKDDDVVSVYGRVDAETGRVTSFSFNYFGIPMTGSGDVIAEEQAAIVGSFLNRMAPDEIGKSELESISVPRLNKDGYAYANYQYSYIRHENGVPYRDNGIYVSFNQYTGKITSYSLNWYDNISFPSINNVLTPERALDAYVGENGSRIVYITTGGGEAALVYDFINYMYIDPFTGKAVDYSGSPWTDATETPEYDDVRGHWSESYVMKLLDNGVFMWGGRFEPEKVMTELDFLRYIMLIEGGYYPRMAGADIAEYYSRRGVEVEASPDKLLTRQEAARIIVDFLGYKQLAEQSEWFVYPFSDNVDAAYKGYITICYMLGIVGGDNGKFDPLMSITRAHAAVLLHNLILAKSS